METKSFALQINTELNLIKRGSRSHRALELVVRAPEGKKQGPRPAMNLALVLDRSGSMGGEKIEYVRQAAVHVLDMLGEGDRVSIVLFENAVTILAESTPITRENREMLKRRVAGVEAGGGTNLGEGWFRGCQQVAFTMISGGQLNRALLLTDGEANVGITSIEELSQHANALAERGVSTSTFGVGAGYNEELLESMARQGQGNFYFISDPEDIPQIFAQEFEELSTITARDVEIEIDLPDGIDAEVLGGLKSETTGRRLRIFTGSLMSGREQPITLNLEMPLFSTSEEVTIRAAARAKGLEGQVLEAAGTVVFHYAKDSEVRSAPLNMEVRKRVALARVSHAASQAIKMEREGRREEAAKLLESTLSHEGKYLSAEQVSYYQGIAMRMRRGMEEVDRKAVHYEAYLANSARVDMTYEKRRGKR